jgi:hypothetical protein
MDTKNILERVREIDETRALKEGDRVLNAGKISEVNQVLSDLEQVYPPRIAAARLEHSDKELRKLEAEYEKKKTEAEELKAEAMEKDASLRGEIEVLTNEKRRVIVEAVEKANGEDVKKFRQALVGVCDAWEEIKSQREEIQAQTGIDLQIRFFLKSVLLPTNHAPDMLPSGDKRLFLRLKEMGLFQ